MWYTHVAEGLMWIRVGRGIRRASKYFKAKRAARVTNGRKDTKRRIRRRN